MNAHHSQHHRIELALILLLLAFVYAARIPAATPQSSLFTADGAWCWFSDPRALYRDGKIYAGWMTADGSVQVGAKDRQSGKLTCATLAKRFQVDDHDHPSLLFLPDGRLAAFYSLHAQGDMHLRVTERPQDLSKWTPDRTLGFDRAGDGPRGTTYSNPAILSGEKNAIYVFWRATDFKPTFSISPDLGETWSPPRTLIRPAGSGNSDRPYVKYWNDGRNRIDFLFTDGHPEVKPANSVFFLRYEKGAFYKADGSRVGTMADLPFDPAQCDRIYDGATAGRAWVWDISEDKNGNPVAAYTRLPARKNHRYHYARWDGRKWIDSEVTSAGKWFPRTPPGKRESEPYYSGGIAIAPRDVSVVYLSRPVKGVYEIERWTTADGGRTWGTQAVTSDSKADNVRPAGVRDAPPGTPELLWMSNSGGYVHYTKYRSEIRMSAP